MRIILASVLGLCCVSSQSLAFRDCPICPEMVEIEGGSFQMGADPATEAQLLLGKKFQNQSQPQRIITVSRFSIGKFEVTRREFGAFVQATGHSRKTARKEWDTLVHNGGSVGAGCFDMDEAFAEYPVGCVTWDDAIAYVAWLRHMTGKPYRLPSEAEWEYAAGTEEKVEGWNRSNSDGRAHPVGQLKPNENGLHDMAGNVWEWAQDCYKQGLNHIPDDGGASGERAWPMKIIFPCLRPIRGGSYPNPWPYTTRAVRFGIEHHESHVYVGFRVAR